MACTCDKDKIKDAHERAVKRIAPFMCDADGNRLFYVDSFGMRGPFPGECAECYETYEARFLKAMEGAYD